MQILIGFLPWIVFFVLFQHKMMLASFIAPIILYLLYWKKNGKKPKLLEYGSCAFFVLFLGLFYLVPHSFLIQYAVLISNGFLALLILITILMKEPFTMSYAKEMTPPERWNTPQFIKINYILSWVWFFYFLFCAALDILKNYHGLNTQIIAIGGLVAVIMFTRRFPKWYMQK